MIRLSMIGSMIAMTAALSASAALAGPQKTRIERTQAAHADGQQFDGAKFDGNWTIETTTTVGDCPALAPGAIAIRDHKIAETAGAQMTPWGYVESNGVIVARFTGQDGRTARAHGQLRAGAGSGAWSSSTDMCGGTWRAFRGGAEQAGR